MIDLVGSGRNGGSYLHAARADDGASSAGAKSVTSAASCVTAAGDGAREGSHAMHDPFELPLMSPRSSRKPALWAAAKRMMRPRGRSSAK